MTTDQKRHSQRASDILLAKSLDLLGAGEHGDAFRAMAGGGAAARQVEYVKRFGSALPVAHPSACKGGDDMGNHD